MSFHLKNKIRLMSLAINQEYITKALILGVLARVRSGSGLMQLAVNRNIFDLISETTVIIAHRPPTH